MSRSLRQVLLSLAVMVTRLAVITTVESKGVRVECVPAVRAMELLASIQTDNAFLSMCGMYKGVYNSVK
jgi:hypothetical protein